MPFGLAKLLAFLVQPSTIAVLAIVVGVVLMGRGKRPRLARRLAWGGLALLFAGGILPLGNALILPLEQRFANVPPPAAGERVAGIILLGGFEDGWVSAGRGGLGLNEAAERVTEGLRVALRHPEAKVVFTGGVASVLASGVSGADPVAAFLREAGIAPERLVLEANARNTFENAVLTRELVKPAPGERWLLVTSAYHMPRAIGLFRKAGFDVTAYPVDYRTRGREDLLRTFGRMPQGLMRLDLAANEWMGLAAYRLLGRIDAFLPGP